METNSVTDSTKTCLVYPQFSLTSTPTIAITIGLSPESQSFVARF